MTWWLFIIVWNYNTINKNIVVANIAGQKNGFRRPFTRQKQQKMPNNVHNKKFKKSNKNISKKNKFLG